MNAYVVFLRMLRRIFAVTIRWSEDTPSKDKRFTAQSAIDSFPIYEYVICLYFSIIRVGVGS